MTSNREFCYLHIGLQKTGTTSLQRNVFRCHSQIHYLGKWPKKAPEFYTLEADILALTRPQTSEQKLQEIASRITPIITQAKAAGKVPVYSREGLARHPTAKIDAATTRFKQVFGPCKVLITLREPVAYVASAYRQSIKRTLFGAEYYFGKSPVLQTVTDYLHQELVSKQLQHDAHLFNYGEAIQVCARVFGKEHVHISLFEQLKEDSASYIAALAKVMQIDPEETSSLFSQAHHNNGWNTAQQAKLDEINSSLLSRLKLQFSTPKQRKEAVGLRALDGQFPKLPVVIPAEYQTIIKELSAPIHRELADTWNLPLEKYQYPM